MEGQSSLRIQAKFSRRILRSPIPNEHPVLKSLKREKQWAILTREYLKIAQYFLAHCITIVVEGTDKRAQLKKRNGLYACVYCINPAHYRQLTKESINFYCWNLIVFIACTGWYMQDCVEETKKLTELKMTKEWCVLEKQWSSVLTKQKQWL